MSGTGLTLPFAGSANSNTVAAFSIANNTSGGPAIVGTSTRAPHQLGAEAPPPPPEPNCIGIHGVSDAGIGVKGESSTTAVLGVSSGEGGTGVLGTGGIGVQGVSQQPRSAGVFGQHTAAAPLGGFGVHGVSQGFYGVYGESSAPMWAAIFGTNASGGPGVSGNGSIGVEGAGPVGVQGTGPIGVQGTGSGGVPGTATVGIQGTGTVGVQGTGQYGVLGAATNQGGVGVRGTSSTSDGIQGLSGPPSTNFSFQLNPSLAAGVRGDAASGYGVAGTSATGVGIFAGSVAATSTAFHAVNQGGGTAGLFDGDMQVNGTVQVTKDIILVGADCAEEFDVTRDAPIEPGTVMVLGRDGVLLPCTDAYDRRVAGVVSGAGSFRPALTLDRRENSPHRSGSYRFTWQGVL